MCSSNLPSIDALSAAIFELVNFSSCRDVLCFDLQTNYGSCLYHTCKWFIGPHLHFSGSVAHCLPKRYFTKRLLAVPPDLQGHQLGSSVERPGSCTRRCKSQAFKQMSPVWAWSRQFQSSWLWSWICALPQFHCFNMTAVIKASSTPAQKKFAD